MMGTSACDFNFFNVTNNPAWTSPQGFRPLISAINSTFGAYQPNQELDVTSVANPFLNVNVATYQDTNETALSLFDGSLDVENDPILPLLVKKRNVDVIVLLDSVSAFTLRVGLRFALTEIRVIVKKSLAKQTKANRMVFLCWLRSRKLPSCLPEQSTFRPLSLTRPMNSFPWD